jgi:hypothetical protein
MSKYSEEARRIWPYILPLVEKVRAAASTTNYVRETVFETGVPSPHARNSVHHTGLEAWGNVDKTGASLADLPTRNHTDLNGIGPDQHHNQEHVLASNVGLGADHTISGAAAGWVLRATSGTAAAFAQLQHDDLGGVTSDQHHAKLHNIVDGAHHTGTGSQWDVVGFGGTNTLAVLASSFNPQATAKILRTDTDGSFAFDSNLLDIDAAGNVVSVSDNLIYADADNKRVGINQTPGNAAIDVIAYSNADHTQRLRQKSGQTGRLWRVEDTAGDELIVLDSQGNLQSGKPGFVSGLTGWQITSTGTAEFNNVWVRGELHATVFVKDEIHATGGTMLVATAGKLMTDAYLFSETGAPYDMQFETSLGLTDWQVETEDGTSVLEVSVLIVAVDLEFETSLGRTDWTVETEDGTSTLQVNSIIIFIEIEDPPSGPGFYFQNGDIVRSKTEVPTGVTDFWLQVGIGTQLDGFARYPVVKKSGTDGILPAGSAVVSYGVPGDGRVLLTSDLNYAPYIDVFTIGPEVWTGNAGAIVPHMRMGRLDGVGVTATSGIRQYGMIAGTDLSNANSPYIVASNLQMRLHKIDLTLNDGTNDTGEWSADGNLTIGANIGTEAGKSFQVITTGDSAGDVIIGQPGEDQYLKWDQSLGTLTVSGALSIGGSEIASVSYVDNQIVLVDAGAQAYASTAQSNAISTAASDATSKANAAQSAAESYAVVQDAALAGTLTVDIDAAKAAAQAYGDSLRVVGVGGTFTVVDADTVSWTSLTIRFGNGVSKSVTNGNTGNMGSSRTYLYVDATAAAPLTMGVTTTIGDIGAAHALIAVCDPGTIKASVSIVAGSTYISGDNILTGSIVAANIQAGAITSTQIASTTITAGNIASGTITALQIAGNTITGNKIAGTTITAANLAADSVTADKIDVTNLQAVSASTGSLAVTGTITVGTTGKILTQGKAYGDSNTGIFLGYDSTTFKFEVRGTSISDRMLFDGANLHIATSSAIQISKSAGGPFIEMLSSAGNANILFNYPVVQIDSPQFVAGAADFTSLVTGGLIVDGNGWRVTQTQTPASAGAAGTAGTWAYDSNFIYVATATNTWKRAALSTW